MAYPTVRVLYCWMAGTTASSWAHPSPSLVDNFANVPHAVDCRRNRSFLRSSMAFTMVCVPYSLTDGSLEWYFFRSLTAYPTVRVPYCPMAGTTAGSWGHISPLPVDDFAIIPHMVNCLWYRSFVRSSTAFTTVYAVYCSVDGSGLLFLALVNGFYDGSHAIFLSGWQRISRTSARQRLSQQIGHRITQWMAAHCSYFRSSMAFTTDWAPYYSADGSSLLILPLVNGVHNGLPTVLLCGWQRIAHSSARQQV